MTKKLQVNGIKTFKNLLKVLQKDEYKDLPSNQIHCHVPICWEEDEAICTEDLGALVEYLTRKNYQFTIYIDSKDPAAFYECKTQVLNKMNSLQIKLSDANVIYINTWRASKERQLASKRYDKFCQKQEYSQAVEAAFQKDIENYCKRPKHKHADVNQVRAHNLETTKDVISWMELKSENNNPNPSKKINVLIYNNPMLQSMHHAKQYADYMGYVKNSLIIAKLTTEVVKEILEPENNQLNTNTYIDPNNISNKDLKLNYNNFPESDNQDRARLIKDVALLLFRAGASAAYIAKYLRELDSEKSKINRKENNEVQVNFQPVLILKKHMDSENSIDIKANTIEEPKITNVTSHIRFFKMSNPNNLTNNCNMDICIPRLSPRTSKSSAS